MPVLLLCQGDVEAKDLLRKSIEARYGVNPPAIESMQINFRGRSRLKLGPVSTWLPVEAEARFVFPTQIRWDFVVKPLYLPIQRGIEAFDGATYRIGRGNASPYEYNETRILASARGRLWAIAALILTPMSDHYIKVTSCGDRCIEALNTKLNDTVKIHLHDDYSINYVEVECLNPETDSIQKHTLKLEHEQQPINNLMLPTKVMAYWDDVLHYEMRPVEVDLHPELPLSLFTLEAAHNGI